MKIVKRTKNYLYVELGEKDQEVVMNSSDLIRVEKRHVEDKTLSDAVKCDEEYEDIFYPSEWVEKVNRWTYKFVLPDDVDEQVEKHNYLESRY